MSTCNQDVSTDDENFVKPLNVKYQPPPPQQQQQQQQIQQPTQSSSPNVSLEITKRRLRLPQVVAAACKEVNEFKIHKEYFLLCIYI